MTRSETYEPLPRCCPVHPDWPTLTRHLIRDFHEVTAADVVEHVAQAQSAVHAFAMEGHDQLRTGELIARHQLRVIAGRIPDIARLDPERHIRRVDAPVHAAATADTAEGSP